MSAIEAVGARSARTVARSVRSWARGNPLFVVGGTMVIALVVVAVFAPLIAPYPADAGSATHPLDIFKPPSWAHLFGTDQVGRDVFSRVVYGARVSPLIALAVVSISMVVGVTVGLVAGFFGGILDEVIMRITDVFLAVPALLLALAFASTLPGGTGSTILAITISWWPWYARLARGEAASVSRRRYVESGRVLGLARWRLLVRHVLPNSTTPVLVQASLDFGGVILTAAALSFLGLGAQDPTPEWGLMVNQGRSFFQTYWWLVTFPGLAILFSAVAFNLLGDGLRDRLDPRRVVAR
ncbi:MAG TPA: ABC transporter permease [Gaiellaceae bacterium]